MFGKKQKGFTILELVVTLVASAFTLFLLVGVVAFFAAIIKFCYNYVFGG